MAARASGASGPVVLDPGKPTVLFTAAQHGNEQSAKEAVLRIVRDLAVGELRPLLAKVNVLAMPQTNPYGNFMDVRANELDLDMNRDHVKLEAEGVRAIHRVFRAFRPEVTIDVHEKGDDYYRVSIGCVSNVNIGKDLQDFSRTVILAEVGKALKKKNTAFHEYLVTEDLGVDTSSGAARPGVRGGRAARGDEALLDDRSQRRPEQPGHLREPVLHPGRGLAPRPGDAPGPDRPGSTTGSAPSSSPSPAMPPRS